MAGTLLLSPGGPEASGNEDVPLLRPQYPANTACADEISAVFEAQEYRTDVLMPWLARSEFWFLLHTHDARFAASAGQRS